MALSSWQGLRSSRWLLGSFIQIFRKVSSRTSLPILVNCSFVGNSLLGILDLLHHHRLPESNHRHLPRHTACPALGSLLSLSRCLQLEPGNSNLWEAIITISTTTRFESHSLWNLGSIARGFCPEKFMISCCSARIPQRRWNCRWWLVKVLSVYFLLQASTIVEGILKRYLAFTSIGSESFPGKLVKTFQLIDRLFPSSVGVVSPITLIDWVVVCFRAAAISFLCLSGMRRRFSASRSTGNSPQMPEHAAGLLSFILKKTNKACAGWRPKWTSQRLPR